MESIEESFKAGFVALVGHPNVGKSTLTNALIGEKVSIVSPKPQTTRTRVNGILNLPNAQAVLVDTPGFCGSETPMRKILRRLAGSAPADSDVTVLVAEVRKGAPQLTAADRELFSMASGGSGRVILAINKIDRLRAKEDLLPWIQFYSEQVDVSSVVPISALKKDGLEQLEQLILDALPESPPLFPLDMHTDQIERRMCEELIREQVLMQTHDEVPHAAAVVVESFEDGRDQKKALCRIEGCIVIERDSQKGIIIGNKGSRIKSISTRARKSIEELLGCDVFLRMQVRVDAQWTKREGALRQYGIGDEES